MCFPPHLNTYNRFPIIFTIFGMFAPAFTLMLFFITDINGKIRWPPNGIYLVALVILYTILISGIVTSIIGCCMRYNSQHINQHNNSETLEIFS